MKFILAGAIILGILVPLYIIMKMLNYNDLIDPFLNVVVTKNDKCYGKFCNEDLFPKQWNEWKDSFKNVKKS